MSNKNFFRLIIAVALGFGGISNTHAEDQNDDWYQIELIVFAHDSETPNSTEVWPDDPGLPDIATAINLTGPDSDSATQQDSSAQQPDTVVDPMTGLVLQQGVTAAVADDRTPQDITTVSLLPQADQQAGTAPTETETPFRLLDAEQLTLNEIDEKLGASADYTPLLHIAWRQPVLARNTAQPVYIATASEPEGMVRPGTLPESGQAADQSGVDGTEALNAPPLELPPANPALNGEADAGPETTGTTVTDTAPRRIEGIITIARGRYLHVQFDLLYRPEQAAQHQGFFSFFATETEPLGYRLQQRRRVRSDELHYFDHPKFGVLTLITSYERPTAEEPSDRTDTPAMN